MVVNNQYRSLHWSHCVGADTGQKVYGNAFPFASLLKRRMDLLDRHGFTTILTSNIPLDESFHASDERTYSCLMGMSIPLLFAGDDARLKMKKIF